MTSMAGLELHEAAAVGDQDSLEQYLRSGKYDANLRDVEWGSRTALHWAATKGFVECIRLLLDYGANGTARMSGGWTPAHSAAEAGRLTVLRALHNAHVSIMKKDKFGERPRHIAETYGHVECVKYLLAAEEEEARRRSTKGLPPESDDSDIEPPDELA